ASSVESLLFAAGYQLSPGNIPLSNTAFWVNNAERKTNLLEYFGDITYRNAYIFAHGTATSFGGKGADGKNDPSTLITDTKLNKYVKNYLNVDKPANLHPYRFVFMDGCELGKGKICEVFGIPAKTTTVAYFATSGVKSRAFLGFKKRTRFNAAQWDYRASTLAAFYQDWLNFNTLGTCISNAVSRTQQPLDPSWVIYGAKDMKVNSP
ncbi:MAG: hypothetical protein ACR2H1_03590, partial [Limisphaerales bacterium]